MTAPRLPDVDGEGAAQRQFERAARAAGFDPEDRWVGGYADYEWDHLRPALQAYGVDVADRDVLEFGCNVGGSSVVLAALGARLSGVDVDPSMIAVADANLDRHGLTAILHAISATGVLPFADGSMDLVVANSVLEYVDPAGLFAVIAEIHRVLRPGGRLFVCGTASRLALRERHSGRWLVNYLPRIFDSLIGRPLQRGLSPRQLARAMRGRFIDVNGDGWLASRRAIHGGAAAQAKILGLLARCLGSSPGWFAPYIELLLRKA